MWLLLLLALILLIALLAALQFWKAILPVAGMMLALLILNKAAWRALKKALEEALENHRDRINYGAKRLGLRIRLSEKATLNPKPFLIGPYLMENLYLVTGTYNSKMEFSISYRHDALKLPKELQEQFLYLAALAEKKAEDAGATYFNGPNTRLIRVINQISQSQSGEEIRQPVLELGPVSWVEYSVLNGFFDHKLKSGKTIRETFARVDQLYENAGDFRWSSLSNIVTLAMVPITSDGFGMIQRRSKGVSTDPGAFTSGVAECMHRYLDEAPVNQLGKRRAPLEKLYSDFGSFEKLSRALIESGIDENYHPSGVPSPLLTAQRGLFEEISEELYRLVPSSSYKFLNIAYGLSSFIPNLVGIVDLGLPREEVDRLMHNSPGRDHHERTKIQYVSLSTNDPETDELLKPRKRESWTPGGLAALVSAIKWHQFQQGNKETI